MAGSMTWRKYVSDDGSDYSIKIDESNARAAFTGGAANPLCPVRTANAVPLYRGIEPRYVLAFNAALPTQRRKFIVGDKTLVPTALGVGVKITGEQYPSAGDTPGSNVQWIVTYYSGEKQRIVPAFDALDTALTDGTPGQ